MKTLYAVILFALLGCRAVTPPAVLTEDKAGHALVMTAIPQSGSRQDVPVDVAPRNAIEMVSPTGAKIVIVKKLFHKPVAYMNEQAKAEGFTVVRPKAPWWQWPALVLSALAVCAGLYFWAKIRAILWWKR